MLVFALAVPPAAALRAQGGATGGSLLEVPATPRALALQGAYVSVVGDEGSVFVNPAGMAAIRHVAVGVSSERGLAGAQLSSAAVALRLNAALDVGLGVVYQDLGGDSVVVPDPSTGNEFGTATGAVASAWNGVAVGALAWRHGMVSLGGSVKWVHSEIGGGPASWSASAVTGDLGFAVAVFDVFSFGAALENLGGAALRGGPAAAPLPRTSRVGFTLNFIDPLGTARLMTTADWVRPPGGDSYWAFGFEGGVVSGGFGALGRLGVSTGRAATDRRGFSLGAGLVLRSLRVDYAWQPYGTLAGSQQRVGVRWIPGEAH